MDLFYSPKDAEDLFDIKLNTYQDLCKLTLKMLKVKGKDEEKFNALEDEMASQPQFNYLSEKENARDTLYYVCLFSRYEKESDQQILHESRESFKTLFM